MAEIWTTKGFIPEELLTFTNGEVNNENEHTTWQEWRDHTGEIVKRDVQVRLKKGQELTLEQGAIG